MKRIIIVGGMGPQASLQLHQELLHTAAANGAQEGDEFPHIVHLSLPVKDFISDQRFAAKALELIAGSLERLYPWQRRQHSHSVQHRSLAFAEVAAAV